jgi:hypothetical protein
MLIDSPRWCRMSAALFVLQLLINLSAAEVFDLQDSAPWLRSKDSDVLFDRGWDAFLVADSSCVRVGARGVQSKPSHWAPRALDPNKWASVACVPGSRGGLCETERGVAFPTRDRVLAPSYDPSWAWGGLACSRASDGRVLVSKSLNYDLSACDALDGGGDIVLCGRTLSFARTALPDWSYWAVCLIAVYSVRSLSYLVAQRVDSGKVERMLWEDAVTVAACLAVLPLALAPDGDAWCVTHEESLFFISTCAYMGVYGCLFVVYALEGGGPDPPVYNLIAATLQVIASRLYVGAETPYNPVVMWAIGTRGLVKLRSERVTTLRVGLSALADSLMLSLMCVLSFEHSPYYLVAVFTLSLATSDAIARDSNADAN